MVRRIKRPAISIDEDVVTILAGTETLFIISDITFDEKLEKRRQTLLELAISVRHLDHLLWLLTQFFSAIQKDLRRQAKAIFVWYPKERADFKMMYDESKVIIENVLFILGLFSKS